MDCASDPGMYDWSASSSETKTAEVSVTSTLIVICSETVGSSTLVAVTLAVYNPGARPTGIGRFNAMLVSPSQASSTGVSSDER